MKVQAFCEEKGLRSFFGVFGYAESKNQCWQASPSNLHISKMAAKIKKKHQLQQKYMFRIPNCYKIIKITFYND